MTDTILAFIQAHAFWAAPITFLLAFGESLAVISLFLPATVMLVAIGGLIGVAHIPLWPIVFAGFLGAVMGDWLSYTVSRHYKDSIASVWPLSCYPETLAKAQALFRKWGAFGVFIGRFSGPLRAVVPLAAGMSEMPWVPFQIANVTSAAVWAVGLLAPGVVLAHWFW